MENIKKPGKFSSFKIVLLYAVVSIIYIYTSDYFLEMAIPNVAVLTKIQTVKGLLFVLITTVILYVLVKRNMDKTASYFNKIINVQMLSDLKLKRSQEEYMALFNHSPLPMWLFDTETLVFLLVNDAACDTYGYTHEEFSKITLKDIRPKEDIPLMEQVLADTLKNPDYPKSNIVRHQKKNGEIIMVKIKTSLITFEGRKVRLAYSADITAEMDVQNKLVDSNSKLQLASEIAGLGYWTNDLSTSEIQWSAELYKIFEVNPETFPLTLASIKERFHPEDQLVFEPKTFNTNEARSITESERRIITDTGQIKWIFERLYVIKDQNGIPIKLEGIALDITKRKLQEAEIRESDERFKILAKATAEAIIDWDIKNDKVLWGEGFHSLFGFDLSVYDNHLWSNNIHPDDRTKVLEDLQTTIEDPTKGIFTAEFRFLKANGDIAYVQHKGVFIRGKDGIATRALGAMIDLTETLERMRKIEAQNNTLKAIAWTQSHVVRAPLANLLGFVNLMKDNSEKGYSNEELIEYVSESAQKLDTIIREIVDKTN